MPVVEKLVIDQEKIYHIMEIKKNRNLDYINLETSVFSGRLDAFVFQKNQIIRVDKKRLVKYLAKKLEKDK